MPFFCDLLQLAPVAPATDTEARFFYLFTGSTIALLSLAFLLVNLLRRKPSIEAEFATKAELKHEVTLLNGTISHLDRRNEEIAKETFGQIKTLTTSVNTGFIEIARTLGRLEGKDK